MNFMEIKQAFTRLEMAAATNVKIAYLKEYLIDDDFAFVVKAALDPFQTYGMSGFVGGVPDTHYPEITMTEFRETIADLASRNLAGNSARVAVTRLNDRGVPAEILNKIFSKDLRCGCGDTLVNKAVANLIPTFKVALADKYSENMDKITFPVFSSPKFDGLRCIVLIDGSGDVRFVSRNGLEFPALSNYKKAWADLGHYNRMFDCEVINGNFFTGGGKVRQKVGKVDTAMFMVFDTMPLRDFLDRAPSFAQWQRLNVLREMLGLRVATDPIQFCPHSAVHSHEEIKLLNESYWAKHLEGSIIKDFDAPYEFRRSPAWTKIKKSLSFDVPITAVVEGKGKYKGMMGALTVDFNGVLTNIGTGFSDKQRDDFWHNKPVGEIAEILCHEETPDKSLRHGVFVRLRPDKRIEDGAGS
ncbi:putative DNA ligase [Xylophilus phage Lumi]|nr:putative DNA ligase [Xylophilus phage Lumi]